jgi:hypothetical protein
MTSGAERFEMSRAPSTAMIPQDAVRLLDLPGVEDVAVTHVSCHVRRRQSGTVGAFEVQPQLQPDLRPLASLAAMPAS